METVVKKLYEAMFLVDSAQAAAEWDKVIATIEELLKGAAADIVSIRKWDERRLAYAIGSKDRGTYILCYFRVEGGRIQEIERGVQLSERIMRVLILCAEHMGQEDLEKDTPATKVEKPQGKSPEAEQKTEESTVSGQANEQVQEETA